VAGGWWLVAGGWWLVNKANGSGQAQTMVRAGALAAGKVMAIVILADLADLLFPAFALYGWAPFFGSLTVALYLTRRERTLLPSRAMSVGVALAAWLAVWFLVLVVSNRQSQEVVEMSWKAAGINSQFSEPEVILGAIRQPGWRIDVVSRELQDYLAQHERSVPVTFDVTRNFGCTRAFRALRIGDLSTWHSTETKMQYVSETHSPWSEPAWCRQF
jgi:hypothetical protein